MFTQGPRVAVLGTRDDEWAAITDARVEDLFRECVCNARILTVGNEREATGFRQKDALCEDGTRKTPGLAARLQWLTPALAIWQ
jgi:hypothetical protein